MTSHGLYALGFLLVIVPGIAIAISKESWGGLAIIFLYGILFIHRIVRSPSIHRPVPRGTKKFQISLWGIFVLFVVISTALWACVWLWKNMLKHSDNLVSDLLFIGLVVVAIAACFLLYFHSRHREEARHSAAQRKLADNCLPEPPLPSTPENSNVPPLGASTEATQGVETKDSNHDDKEKPQATQPPK